MNKATLLNIINEEFVGTVRKNKEEFKIYRNPTSKDMNDLVMEQHERSQVRYLNPKLIRFIVDLQNKAVFVHSAGIIHADAAEKLGLPHYIPVSRRYFSGTAKLDGGRMTIINSDNLDAAGDKKLARDLAMNDWKFSMRYFDTDIPAFLAKHQKTGKVKDIKDM